MNGLYARIRAAPCGATGPQMDDRRGRDKRRPDEHDRGRAEGAAPRATCNHRPTSANRPGRVGDRVSVLGPGHPRPLPRQEGAEETPKAIVAFVCALRPVSSRTARPASFGVAVAWTTEPVTFLQSSYPALPSVSPLDRGSRGVHGQGPAVARVEGTRVLRGPPTCRSRRPRRVRSSRAPAPGGAPWPWAGRSSSARPRRADRSRRRKRQRPGPSRGRRAARCR